MVHVFGDIYTMSPMLRGDERVCTPGEPFPLDSDSWAAVVYHPHSEPIGAGAWHCPVCGMRTRIEAVA